jgi:hypothetical protein
VAIVVSSGNRLSKDTPQGKPLSANNDPQKEGILPDKEKWRKKVKDGVVGFMKELQAWVCALSFGVGTAVAAEQASNTPSNSLNKKTEEQK